MANGIYVHDGAIAVDPDIIRLGSIINVDGQDFVASDTGGDIRGNRLDIWMNNCRNAIQYGIRKVKVYFK